MKKLLLIFLFILIAVPVMGQAITRVYIPYDVVFFDKSQEVDATHATIADYDTSSVLFGKTSNEYYLKILDKDGGLQFYVTVDGDVQLPASRYISWGATLGSSGYGLRDNSGTMEFKSSGGSWLPMGSGGDSLYVELSPLSAKLSGDDITDAAEIYGGDRGWKALFDDGDTNEEALWEFVADNYQGGDISVDIYVTMASATSNEVEFEGKFDCISDEDSQDVDVASYASSRVSSETVPGTAGHEFIVTITFTAAQADNMTDGDHVFFHLTTDADDAVNDDATGDREVRKIVIHE